MANNPIELIVGLGNPGSGYEKTRHNAGFWCIDKLAAQHKAVFKEERRFHGFVTTINHDGHRCYLLKPNTYMNRSGQAVHALVKFYKIPMEHVLVVHDELDLEPGSVRLKEGGGHGGHNGLRDIITTCAGNSDFMRLRIGIGHPGEKSKVVQYVLNRPNNDELQLITQSIDAACDLMPDVLDGEFSQVMNNLHSRV